MRYRQNLVSFALFLCVFLAVFNEVLLSPFYPQFFRKVFGVEDLAYTGYYIFICRLTVVLCAPIWGILSRNIEVKYLLYIGQAGTAIMTALMGTSNSASQFLVYTIILLLFKSSYLLVYPLIIQLAGKQKRATVAGIYQAVFHGAIVAATIAGAGMVNFATPLRLFYLIAIADVVQLIICIYILQGVSARKEDKQNSENAPVVSNQLGFIVAIGMVILSFQLANNLVRPYFTEYVTTNFININLLSSSLLFLIPSIMAIAALPYIRKACKPKALPSIYLVGICLLATSLFFQGWTQNIVVLILARVVYGFCLAVTQAALELQLFNSSASNRLHFNYSLTTSFANVGHLAAPLMASWLVNTYSLAVPFLAAGVIGSVNLIFARFAVFKKSSLPLSKISHHP
ncbi:MFS transporter [Rivularia sp. UHCC 0363]|uniref:MFS transporter n=1 Tax=Rivularia sp. UHCC 0363 TaxID=3110244 RepID=UPI002B2074AA|nr:MFS transporter [Rivularia sp. UHCC 0363]MEA5598166.1 MFS transporter [Rivularia sp. UHCC 0363]